MPIDLSAESVIGMPEASRRLPGCPNLSTLHRWRLHGCRGHKLDTVLVGGRRYTSIEALDRFLAAINGGAIATPNLTAAAARSQKATAAALRERHGITIAP